MSPTDTNYTYKRDSGFLDRAFYGELTRHLTDKSEHGWRTNVLAGFFAKLIYTAALRRADVVDPTTASEPNGPFGDDDRQNLSFRNHLWKLNSSYAITDTMRVYSTFSEGSDTAA